jgi:hypothetical protein
MQYLTVVVLNVERRRMYLHIHTNHFHRNIFNALILLFPLIILLSVDDLSSQKPVITVTVTHCLHITHYLTMQSRTQLVLEHMQAHTTQ